MPTAFLKARPIEIVFGQAESKNKDDSGKVRAPIKLQLMKKGLFSYYDKDDTPITSQMFSDMIGNFQKGTVNSDIPLNYSHDRYGPASGWIKDLMLGENGDTLWAEVKWTPKGEQSVVDGEFKYVSVEFNPNYTDEMGRDCGVCLTGAGLLNRPFLKGMEPLSEFGENKKGENAMSLTLDELQKKMDKQFSDMQATVKTLQDTITAQEKVLGERDGKILELEKKRKEDEDKFQRETAFNKLFAEGKVCEAQREPFLKNDTVKFAELRTELNLGAKGSSKTEGAQIDGKEFKDMSPIQAEQKLMEIAMAKMKEDKGLSFSEASSAAVKENKILADKRAMKEPEDISA